MGVSDGVNKSAGNSAEVNKAALGPIQDDGGTARRDGPRRGFDVTERS